MLDTQTIVMLAIGAGAAAWGYLYWKKQRAAKTAPTTVVPVSVATVQKVANTPLSTATQGAPVSTISQTVAAVVSGGVVTVHDPIVPQGTTGTVTLNMTGHVLSTPRLDLNESLASYYTRVASQAGGDPNQMFTFAQAGGAANVAAAAGLDINNAGNWARLVDQFCNPVAYMSPTQLAAYAASQASWTAQKNALIAASQTPAANSQAALVQDNKINQTAVATAAVTAAVGFVAPAVPVTPATPAAPALPAVPLNVAG